MTTVDRGFLQLSIKYEYFKRNTAMQAHLNVCELVRLWPSKGPYKEFSFVPPEHRDEPRLGSVKRQRQDQPETSSSFKKTKVDDSNEEKKIYHDLDNPTPNSSNPESSKPESSDQDAPDTDSDDHEVFFEKPDYSNPRGQCTLKKTRDLYKKIAERELLELRKGNARFSELMCMQRIAKPQFIHILQSVCHLLKGIRTVNGYRKLTMIVTCEKQDPMSITYMSSEEGCLIWYGNDLKVDNTIKYQSLAAHDFFYLVQDKGVHYDELEFDVEPYRKCDPPIWPFDSFYFKLQKYLTNSTLDVENFSMRVFNNRGLTKNGKEFLMNVINLLKPRSLKYLKLRVWNDSEVIVRRRNINPVQEEFLEVLYKTLYWGFIRRLDFAGPEFKISNFRSFFNFNHFETVSAIDQDDFYPLLRAYAVFEDWQVNRSRVTQFYVNDEFDFREGIHTISTFVSSIPILVEGVRIHQLLYLFNGVMVTLQEEHRWIVIAL